MDERFAPDRQRARRPLLREDEFPVVVPQRHQVAVIGEIEKAGARALDFLPVRYGSRL